jgi:hypothetical protein
MALYQSILAQSLEEYLMNSQTLRTISALVLSAGLTLASSAHAVIFNETLSRGVTLDRYRLDCPAGTATAAARVSERSIPGDANVLSVVVLHSNGNCAADAQLAPSSGAVSINAIAACGATGLYYVVISKSQKGAESYRTEITCRSSAGTSLVPDALSNPPLQDE